MYRTIKVFVCTRNPKLHNFCSELLVSFIRNYPFYKKLNDDLPTHVFDASNFLTL